MQDGEAVHDSTRDQQRMNDVLFRFYIRIVVRSAYGHDTSPAWLLLRFF